MRSRTIDVTTHAPVGREVIFGPLSDGATWPRWAPIDSFRLERAGDPPPEGPGAIRVFQRRRTTGRDQIVAVVAGSRLEYVSLSGLPVRDYRAVVELEDAGDGTTIHWHAQFVPKVWGSGWIIERGLRRFLAGCARGLAGYARAGVDESSS